MHLISRAGLGLGTRSVRPWALKRLPANEGCVRHQITEQPKALGVQVARQEGDPGYVAPWVIETGDIAGLHRIQHHP